MRAMKARRAKYLTFDECQLHACVEDTHGLHDQAPGRLSIYFYVFGAFLWKKSRVFFFISDRRVRIKGIKIVLTGRNIFLNLITGTVSGKKKLARANSLYVVV